MRLHRRIFWITIAICAFSLFFFIAFKTFWNEYDNNDIFANISIGIFGSSLLVFIPALITFFNIKNSTQQKIISELNMIEKLVNDLQFKTTFLKDENRDYTLDFSFEKTKYDDNSNTTLYLAKKDVYENSARRVESLYQTIKQVDAFDYSLLDSFLNDYVGIFHNEKYIKALIKKHRGIIESVMISKYQLPYAYGARQYECCNASIGQFFEIWFKEFLIKIDPIDVKLESLKTILTLIRIKFNNNDYNDMLNCNDQGAKRTFVINAKNFYAENNIKPCFKTKRRLKHISDSIVDITTNV